MWGGGVPCAGLALEVCREPRRADGRDLGMDLGRDLRYGTVRS